YMQGPVICAFRGGWGTGNYGYALWMILGRLMSP
ncbi:unnamed protein product, partial [marine sediment metagenome]